MRKSLLAASMTLWFALGATTASAQGVEFTSATACKAAQAWDATAAKCVDCKSLVTEANSLKSCTACQAGTAFDIKAARCVKVTVKKN
jgi:hypothetical protein